MTQQPNGHPRKTNRVQGRDGRTPGPRPAGPAPQGSPAQQPVASLEVLQAEFEALEFSNRQKFEELAKAGATPDPLYLVHARINSLIESISAFAGPNGPRWAAMARLTFERQISAELSQAGPALQRMQLAEGARYTPAMIRALAAQTGTFRPRTQ